MKSRAAALYLAAMLSASVLAFSAGAQGNPPAYERAKVIEEIIGIVRENFYQPDRVNGFVNRARQMGAMRAPALPLTTGGSSFDADVRDLLASLNASHTARYLKSDPAYYELLDIYKAGPISERFDKLFPPDGRVTYRGLGLATKEVEGRHFVSQIYDTSPASKADILVGDEIISIDGRPWTGAPVFANGEIEAVLELKRSASASPTEVQVAVEDINPSALFYEAIMASIKVMDVQNRKLGYIRIWSADTQGLFGDLARELTTGRLMDIDGLVLDLRSRWGGGPLDAANLFVGAVPNISMRLRDGEIIQRNIRWDKPVIGIIDSGTRSGLESLAYTLQKNGVQLVGENTAGASLAATAFLLPDDSLLTLAVGESIIDGQRLEGRGVAPDIAVPFDLRYAAGKDPQLRAAADELVSNLDEQPARQIRR